MKLYRLSLPLLVLLVPAGAHCEPAYDAPPPALPAAPDGPPAAPGDAPPPPPPYPGDPSQQGDPAQQGDPNAGTPPPPPEGEPGAPGDVPIGEDTDSYADDDPSALTDFRPTLDPYGTWADDPTYGTVWVPAPNAVGPDFQPYVTSGHWVYDDDWVWVSDYSWGWAPFHYGHWVLIDGRGWAWIPGRAYRGAWVDWSVDDGYGYLGWAPAPPLFVWFGGGPVVWRRGYIAPHWVYCPRAAVFAPAVSARLVVGPAAVTLAGHMRLYATATARVGGPAPARFGYTAAQIPHATGEAQSHLAHAQQFSRPSTAQPLGARAPTVRNAPAGRPGGAGPGAAPRPGGAPGGGHGGGGAPGGGGPHFGGGGPAPHGPAPRGPSGGPHVGGGHHR
jgi:hypothetical protein